MKPRKVGCMQLLPRAGAIGDEGLRPCAEADFWVKLPAICDVGEPWMAVGGGAGAKPNGLDKVVLCCEGLTSSRDWDWDCDCDW